MAVRELVGAALLLVCCARVEAQPATPVADTSIVQTLRAATSPIFLVVDASGLRARSVDGTVNRTLVARAGIGQSSWDSQRELVWFIAQSTLHVVDLRAKTADAIPIASNLPRDVAVRVAWTKAEIKPPDAFSSRAEIVIVLGVDGKIAAKGQAVKGVDWEMWYQGSSGEAKVAETAKRARQVVIAKEAAPWVATQAGRTLRAVPRDDAKFSARARIALPNKFKEGCEEDPEICGMNAPFGKWRIVYVAHSCGDFCYQECLLFDARKNLWAVPPVTTKWTTVDKIDAAGACGDYNFDRSNTAFLTGTSVCKVGGACTPVPGFVVDWIDGGPKLTVPEINGPP